MHTSDVSQPNPTGAGSPGQPRQRDRL